MSSKCQNGITSHIPFPLSNQLDEDVREARIAPDFCSPFCSQQYGLCAGCVFSHDFFLSHANCCTTGATSDKSGVGCLILLQAHSGALLELYF